MFLPQLFHKLRGFSSFYRAFDTEALYITLGLGLSLDPIVIQAIWRCMLGGNNHWVTYRCSDKTNKHSGINDQKWSTGHKDHKGVDRRRYAGAPYNFTVDEVDQKRLCFAFWSMNGAQHKQMCTYACSDFEPLKPARKTKKPQRVALTDAGSRIHPNPTPKHRHRVFQQAYNCYNDICQYLLRRRPHRRLLPSRI